MEWLIVFGETNNAVTGRYYPIQPGISEVPGIMAKKRRGGDQESSSDVALRIVNFFVQVP